VPIEVSRIRAVQPLGRSGSSVICRTLGAERAESEKPLWIPVRASGGQAVGLLVGITCPGQFDDITVPAFGDRRRAESEGLEIGGGKSGESIEVAVIECFKKRGPEAAFDFECGVFGSPDVQLRCFVEHDRRGRCGRFDRGRLVAECRNQPRGISEQDEESHDGEASLQRIHAWGLVPNRVLRMRGNCINCRSVTKQRSRSMARSPQPARKSLPRLSSEFLTSTRRVMSSPTALPAARMRS
jgi:hypothetical protein